MNVEKSYTDKMYCLQKQLEALPIKPTAYLMKIWYGQTESALLDTFGKESEEVGKFLKVRRKFLTIGSHWTSENLDIVKKSKTEAHKLIEGIIQALEIEKFGKQIIITEDEKKSNWFLNIFSKKWKNDVFAALSATFLAWLVPYVLSLKNGVKLSTTYLAIWKDFFNPSTHFSLLHWLSIGIISALIILFILFIIRNKSTHN